jgi:hypothetical protein
MVMEMLRMRMKITIMVENLKERHNFNNMMFQKKLEKKHLLSGVV